LQFGQKIAKENVSATQIPFSTKLSYNGAFKGQLKIVFLAIAKFIVLDNDHDS